VKTCPGPMEAQPGVMMNHHRGAEDNIIDVKAHPVALEAHPGGMEIHYSKVLYKLTQ
jgi:hypothetical protein